MLEKRAVFLDRDGVINEFNYFAEHGRIDTPLKPQQFRLIPGVAKGIKGFSSLLVQVMERKELYPTYLAESFDEAVHFILERGAEGRVNERDLRVVRK
jgi:hypothetical protein